jgi:anti-anti-sigma factor
MAILSTFASDGVLTLRVTGRFDYQAREEFERSWRETGGMPSRYVVDLRSTTYIDSCGLGMLLELRANAKSIGVGVALAGANTAVARTLQVAQFGTYFEVA